MFKNQRLNKESLTSKIEIKRICFERFTRIFTEISSKLNGYVPELDKSLRSVRLLHRHRLRQVAWFVHIRAARQCGVIRQ
jgi:hypothetical protein